MDGRFNATVADCIESWAWSAEAQQLQPQWRQECPSGLRVLPETVILQIRAIKPQTPPSAEPSRVSKTEADSSQHFNLFLLPAASAKVGANFPPLTAQQVLDTLVNELYNLGLYVVRSTIISLPDSSISFPISFRRHRHLVEGGSATMAKLAALIVHGALPLFFKHQFFQPANTTTPPSLFPHRVHPAARLGHAVELQLPLRAARGGVRMAGIKA